MSILKKFHSIWWHEIYTHVTSVNRNLTNGLEHMLKWVKVRISITSETIFYLHRGLPSIPSSTGVNPKMIRTFFLHRGLRSILASTGVNPEMITVYIDGFHFEPKAIAQLLGIKSVHMPPHGVSDNCSLAFDNYLFFLMYFFARWI